jgi:TP901 family phage tail tape measure protein
LPDYAVSTAFTANNKVGRVFDAMGRDADKFGGKASAAFNKAGRSGSRFGDIVKGVLAAGVIQRGFGMLAAGLRNVTGQFVEFDDAVIGAAARFKDIGPDAANFDDQLNLIKRSARDAGAATKFTAAQAAAGLDFLARAGFTSAEAMGSLTSMINLATSTGEDFATVADYSSDLLGAFGLSVNDTAQKIANLNRLNDVLVKSANSANVTVETMFETMKTAGPVSRIIGASLEEVAAATAILGNAGIKGTEAATALKNSMLRLADANIQKMLHANGVEVADSAGNMRKYSVILSELGNKIKGLGTAKQAQILNDVFGLRAIAGAKTLMENLGGLSEFEQMLKDAAGTSERTADRLKQSWGNRLLSLGSAVAEFGFQILDAFGTDGKRGIDAITDSIRKFDTGPLIAGLRTAWSVAVGLYGAIAPFLPLLPYLIGWFVIFKTLMAGMGVAHAVMGFIQFAMVLKNTAGAMGLLNVMMTANPVGLIIAGIAALIVLFIYLEKRFGIFSKGWEMVKTAFVATVGFMKTVFMQFASFYVNLWAGIIGTVIAGVSKLGGMIGIDTSGLDALAARVEKFRSEVDTAANGGSPAPNSKEAEARQIQFTGQLNIAGAPAGSTMESKTTGAPALSTNLLGVNP